MADSEKKEAAMGDIDAAGEAREKAPSTAAGAERADASTKKELAKASKEAVPVAPASDSGVSTVDRSDRKTIGLPKDGQALMAVALGVMEKDLKEPDSKVKQSLFLQGIYAGLKLYNNLFAFALTPGDFMASVDALNPSEAFSEDAMKQLWEKRLKVRYVELWKKIESAKTLKEEMLSIEERLAKFSGVDTTDREAFGKFKKELREKYKIDFDTYLESDKSPLIEEELAKFMKNKESDSYISTYFVLKQLGALPALKDGEKIEDVCDPKKLMSKLMHADYDDHSNKSRQNLFTKVDRQNEVMDLYQSGNLPAGTVVFFEKYLPDESKILMCGITGMDGKIRYQTGENGGKLEELNTFSPEVGKSIASLTDTFGKLKKDGKIPDFGAVDQLKSTVSGVLSGQSSGIQFIGAFIPNSELGISKKDPESGADSQYLVSSGGQEKAVEEKPRPVEDVLGETEPLAPAEKTEKPVAPEATPGTPADAPHEPPDAEAPEEPKEQTEG